MANSQFSITKCSSPDDPLEQLHFLTYPREKINESYLLALDDCLKKLPMDHPLRRRVKLGDRIYKNEEHRKIFNLLQNELKGTWIKTRAISPEQREKILQILYILNPEKYYLDLLVLKIIFYKKIGNESIIAELIKDWLNISPFDYLSHAPRRDDALSDFLKLIQEEMWDSLKTSVYDKHLWNLFLLKITWIYSEENLKKWASKNMTQSTESLIEELRLRHQAQKAGVFGQWLFNQELEGVRYEKFLRDTVDLLPEENLWIFLTRPPEVAELRDRLLARVALMKEHQPLIYESFLDHPQMRQGLVKFNPSVLKSYLQSKREFIHQRLKAQPGDLWALYESLYIGDLSPEVFRFWN